MYERPPRLILLNLETEEKLQAQFNPEQLALGIKAVYNKQVIPGMSHTLRQFSHTDDLTLQFDLAFRVTDYPAFGPLMGPAVPGASFTLKDRLAAERFLLSLVVPRGGAEVIGRNSPPSVLVVWPHFLAFTAIVLDVQFRYTAFNVQGHPTEFSATLSIEEMRDIRYTSLDARQDGFVRSRHARTGEFF